MPYAKIKYFNIILLKYSTLKCESIVSSFYSCRMWYLLYIHLDSQSTLELKNDKYKNYNMKVVEVLDIFSYIVVNFKASGLEGTEAHNHTCS